MMLENDSLEMDVRNAVMRGANLPEIWKMVTMIAVNESLKMQHGNQTQAAKRLGINRGTLRKYIK